MKVPLPELYQLQALEVRLKAAKTPKQYAKVKAEIDFIYEKLRRELAEQDE